MSKELDLAWAAGLFDGEGCFSITNERKSYNIKAILEMTHKETVEDFYDIVQVGLVKNILKSGNRKDTRCWYVAGENTVKVAKVLLPYLRTKRLQAERILEFDSLWRRRCSQWDEPLTIDQVSTMEFIIKEMRELNKRGV